MAITVKDVEELREKLKTAPEVSPERRQVSKQEAIQALKAEIETLKKRGYTLDEIAKLISENGIKITTPTLKSYMQRSKTRRKPRTSTSTTETTTTGETTPDTGESEKTQESTISGR